MTGPKLPVGVISFANADAVASVAGGSRTILRRETHAHHSEMSRPRRRRDTPSCPPAHPHIPSNRFRNRPRAGRSRHAGVSASPPRGPGRTSPPVPAPSRHPRRPGGLHERRATSGSAPSAHTPPHASPRMKVWRDRRAFRPTARKIAFTAPVRRRDRRLRGRRGRGNARCGSPGIPPERSSLGWTPDGRSVLFRSSRNIAVWRDRLWTVPATGGSAQLLPIPYAQFASITADGKRIAYVPVSAEWQHWKRYRGGEADDVWLADTRGATPSAS